MYDKVNIATKRENTRKYPKEITELKNTILKLKNSIKWFNRRLDEVEKMIRELENRAVGSIQLEEQKESEDSLVALWENIK